MACNIQYDECEVCGAKFYDDCLPFQLKHICHECREKKVTLELTNAELMKFFSR